MKRNLLTFLNGEYSAKPELVNRLIVSTFLKTLGKDSFNNAFLNSLVIEKKDLKENVRLENFIRLLNEEKTSISIEDVIELFEFVISPKDKIVSGAVYTPAYIREFIVRESYKNIPRNILSSSRTCDMSCGCGGFLLTAAKELKRTTGKSYSQVFRENIFGLDIKDYSIVRTKILLSLLAVSEGEDEVNFEFNLAIGDALNYNWNSMIPQFPGFDFIIGNPPYVCSRNIGESTKKYLKDWSVCSTGHPDLYIPFFQIGIENLNAHGKLGYITVNSFFKSLNGRALRDYFAQKKLQFKIIDFGSKQIFPKKSTYTCICFVENNEADVIKYIRWEDDKPLEAAKDFSTVYYRRLNAVKGWNLFNTDVVERIEQAGKPFEEVYTTRNGIATLKNEIYIFEPYDKDKRFYYLKNGDVYKIERDLCKNVVNPNRLTTQQNLRALFEKLIFPYQFQDGRAEILSGQLLKEKYPFAFSYLEKKRKVLNSRDKGKAEGLYEKWFAFGRRQSLERFRFKLFFPHIAPNTPNFIINSSPDLFFYNGLAVVSNNQDEIKVLKKILQSKIFWHYITSTSKPYSAKFYSLSRNYIKNFGIPEFTEEEKAFLIREPNQNAVDRFLIRKYNLQDVLK